MMRAVRRDWEISSISLHATRLPSYNPGAQYTQAAGTNLGTQQAAVVDVKEKRRRVVQAGVAGSQTSGYSPRGAAKDEGVVAGCHKISPVWFEEDLRLIHDACVKLGRGGFAYVRSHVYNSRIEVAESYLSSLARQVRRSAGVQTWGRPWDRR